MAVLDLPKLLLIADRFCDPEIGDRLLELVSSGLIPWIQLRDHSVGSYVFAEKAVSMVDAIRSREAKAAAAAAAGSEFGRIRISLNGHVELARRLDVGVHVGFRGPAPDVARSVLGPAGLVGFSAHSESDLTETVVRSVDYFTISPIYPPISKPGISGAGLGLLSHFAEACPKPVFALGGITPDRISDCFRTGAYGVAVVGGILGSENPVAAARGFAAESGLSE